MQASGMTALLKVCGITNWADAKLAVDAGADMLGLNFYPPSPRFVTVSAARRIVKRLPKGVAAVGVFVNDDWDDVADLANIIGLRAVQLHGEETPEEVAKLKRRCKVIKAFRVRPGFDLVGLRRYAKASAFLLDGFSRRTRGGTGKTFDWRVARRAAHYGRIFLAGGLTAENIAEALATAKPYAVDVCSGVEASPGKKDHAELLKFALRFHSANHP
jgi:phosphoribosylanthranilate isomerase